MHFDREISISIILHRTHKKLRETKTTAVLVVFHTLQHNSNKMSQIVTENPPGKRHLGGPCWRGCDSPTWPQQGANHLPLEVIAVPKGLVYSAGREGEQ